MSSQIMSVDTSTILEGRLDEVKEAIAHMASFVEMNEPDMLLYQVFTVHRFERGTARFTAR